MESYTIFDGKIDVCEHFSIIIMVKMAENEFMQMIVAKMTHICIKLQQRCKTTRKNFINEQWQSKITFIAPFCYNDKIDDCKHYTNVFMANMPVKWWERMEIPITNSINLWKLYETVKLVKRKNN